MQKLRIIIYQKPLGVSVSHYDAAVMRDFKPHFVCFPEYFFVNRRLGNHIQTTHNFERQIKRIKTISINLNAVVIGGSTPEPENELLFNTSFIYSNGTLLGSYRKQNLFHAEEGKITPGRSLRVFETYGIKFGVLICADVFKDENFTAMKKLGAKIIFIPTFSPKKEETPGEKFKRDNEIFVHAASISGALIVKACGVKSEFKASLQARSLIADKSGVLFRVTPEEEDKSMIIKYETEI
jgi:predicted amidohydrolase